MTAAIATQQKATHRITVHVDSNNYFKTVTRNVIWRESGMYIRLNNEIVRVYRQDLEYFVQDYQGPTWADRMLAKTEAVEQEQVAEVTIPVEAPAKSKKAEKSVEIINRQAINTSIVFTVRNGENKLYRPTLHANGRYSCIDENDETCKAVYYGHKCYHVATCEQSETPLNFGKYAGKSFSQLPVSYIKWLARHETRLAPEHRHLAKIAQNWHISQTSEKQVEVVTERHTEELPVIQPAKVSVAGPTINDVLEKMGRAPLNGNHGFSLLR